MSTSMDELSKRFDGFELMMQLTLDKVTFFDAWKTKADESLDVLRHTADDTAAWLLRLEAPPPPPPPPQ